MARAPGEAVSETNAQAEARAEIFAWLNWYNTIQLHSSLDFCPPIEYEEHLARQSLVA